MFWNQPDGHDYVVEVLQSDGEWVFFGSFLHELFSKEEAAEVARAAGAQGYDTRIVKVSRYAAQLPARYVRCSILRVIPKPRG